ncbi:MAG: hypothetical protein K2F99_08865 [Muribaculaceae bacterium]|nr:hypothetical protein [Muribaculaceae bacterium]
MPAAKKETTETKTVDKTEEVKETPVKKTTPKAVPKEVAPKEKPAVLAKVPKLEDSVRVRVRSNQYGKLGYINKRTRDRIMWEDIDDVQDLTVGDIRDMKNNAPKFFSEPWVWVESIEEPGCEDLTTETIYEALGLGRFLKNAKSPIFLKEVCNWKVAEIREKAPEMSANTKSNVVIALNTEIKNGNLNDLRRIKAWEEALGFELDHR